MSVGLKIVLKKSVGSLTVKRITDPASSILNATEYFSAGLVQLQVSMAQPQMRAILNSAAELIFSMKGRLIISGVGKSGHVASKLAATFSSTGTPAYFVHAAEASHGDLGMIKSDDVVMLLSWSGETSELSDITAYAARFNVPIIAITGKFDGTLALHAQYPIVLPTAKEACPHNLAPTTSTLLQMATGDALAVTLLKMRGFSEESFRNFHPAGNLGAALQPISELMYRDNSLPLLSQNAPIFNSIAEISQKGFGIVGLLNSSGKLCGVITDGDIRRYLEKNATGTMQEVMWSALAKDIMSPAPVTLNPENLVGRSLHTMQTRKISAVFVVQDAAPIGIVTVLQLLQSGIA
jgi:arabinose-5-phosphate isomerase